MVAKLIKTRAEHAAALARVERLLDARPGTPAFNELELLTHLIDVYEDETMPVALPDPVAAIRFRMEQQGLRPKDLVPFLGSPGKVSEVLSGRRRLSLTMIRKLVQGLGLSAAVLIGPPAPPRRRSGQVRTQSRVSSQQ